MSEISGFRASLWSWLGGVAILLLALQLLLLRWGLSPLHRMARDLKKIESGEREQLEGIYPRELRGVTDNLNLLIKSERKRQSRYRTTLGDLAHSLKTPLAVVAGVMDNFSRHRPANLSADLQQQVDTVEEQLARMNQIVSYQLQRAVKANSSSNLLRQVSVQQTVEKLLQVLDKVYVNKPMSKELHLDSNAVFSGDERDLMEVLGNVLDNAFKYGTSKIRIVVSKSTRSDSLQDGISIVVEDDGPGITPDKRLYVLQRGARADTLAQGQGIGLAVVTDIVSSYNGSIGVDASDLGGARINIVFAPSPDTTN